MTGKGNGIDGMPTKVDTNNEERPTYTHVELEAGHRKMPIWMVGENYRWTWKQDTLPQQAVLRQTVVGYVIRLLERL